MSFLELLMRIFPWAVSAVNIMGCYLNAKKNIICWPLWIGSAILNSWYFIFYKPDYGIAFLWLAYIGFDIYGFFQWRKK
jgi:hypothetical protein